MTSSQGCTQSMPKRQCTMHGATYVLTLFSFSALKRTIPPVFIYTGDRDGGAAPHQCLLMSVASYPRQLMLTWVPSILCLAHHYHYSLSQVPKQVAAVRVCVMPLAISMRTLVCARACVRACVCFTKPTNSREWVRGGTPSVSSRVDGSKLPRLNADNCCAQFNPLWRHVIPRRRRRHRRPCITL